MEKHSVNIVSHDMSPTLTWPSTPRMKSIKKVKITINLESCSEANGDLDEVSHLWTNKTMSHTPLSNSKPFYNPSSLSSSLAFILV